MNDNSDSIIPRKMRALELANELGWKELYEMLNEVRFEHFDKGILLETQEIAALWQIEIAALEANDKAESLRIAQLIAESSKNAQEKAHIGRFDRLNISAP